MRILIPILGFAPQGGYRVLSELANAWIRRGHDCDFLVPATSAEPYFPTNARVIRCDLRGRFFDKPSYRKRAGHDNLMSLFAGLQRIGRSYEVILANHSLTAWPVRWARTGSATKLYYVQAYEPFYYNPLKAPFKHLLARHSYRLNLRQITNSQVYRGVGLDPVDCIPPGIDLSIFVPKAAPGSFASAGEIVLGTIGRTEPYKGTTTALAAYRLLRNEDPRLRMNVGFGNVEPAADINIVPIQGDTALSAYYRSVDVLVVSCRGQHGAPHYPLIEAMASGTPVVHTGYFPGDESNSWMAADPSVRSVAEALRSAIHSSDKERRERAAAARKTVERDLSWDAIAQRFEVHFRG